jgi:hypothetical protein
MSLDVTCHRQVAALSHAVALQGPILLARQCIALSNDIGGPAFVYLEAY